MIDESAQNGTSRRGQRELLTQDLVRDNTRLLREAVVPSG